MATRTRAKNLTRQARSRRRWLAATSSAVAVLVAPAAALAVAPGASSASPGGPTWPVLVADHSASEVTDLGHSFSATIALGVMPTSVVVTPDGRYAYVADRLSNSVSVIANPATSTASLVATLSVGSGPTIAAITPDGRYAYVTDSGTNKVSVIDNADSADPSVSASTLTVGNGPDGIAITPDGDYGYVADSASNTVSVIDNADSASPSVSASTLTVGSGPSSVAITPDGRFAYVTNGTATTVSVIDNPDSASPSVASTLTVGSDPSAVALTPDGAYGYVTDEGTGKVSVIDNADSASPSVSASTLSVGTEPQDVAISPDGNDAYVANEGSNSITTIGGADSGSPSVSGSTSTGTAPVGVAVMPDQAPVAHLSVVPGLLGSATSFSASGSTVAFGTIASYSWSFGDGSNTTTTTPTASHTYAALGTYAVSVTETDSTGTSTSQVTDGRAVLRDGSSAAEASGSVTIASLCAASAGATSCALSTSLSVAAGTLSVEAPAVLYWDEVLSGYDQWESASAAPLSGCSASGEATTCTGGTAPLVEVIDNTGSGAGWALSEYLTSSDLPSGSVVEFDGAGSTPGDSLVAPLTAFPFSALAPQSVCDYGSTCNIATPATSYPPSLAAGTSSANQVNLYWAWIDSGMGALCLASGSATAAGCTGANPDADFDLGIPGNTHAATDASTVITLTVSSGP